MNVSMSPTELAGSPLHRNQPVSASRRPVQGICYAKGRGPGLRRGAGGPAWQTRCCHDEPGQTREGGGCSRPGAGPAAFPSAAPDAARAFDPASGRLADPRDSAATHPDRRRPAVMNSAFGTSADRYGVEGVVGVRAITHYAGRFFSPVYGYCEWKRGLHTASCAIGCMTVPGDRHQGCGSQNA